VLLLRLQLQMGMPDLVLFNTAFPGHARPSKHTITVPAHAGCSGLGRGLGQERLLLVGACCMHDSKCMTSGVVYMLHAAPAWDAPGCQVSWCFSPTPSNA